MKNFEFKSQICTTREQSERLLKLGLKKGTADMSWFRRSMNADFECCTSSYTEWVEEILPIVDDYTLKDIIPAWSLGRLIKDLMPQSIGHLELAVGSDYAGYYEDKCNSKFGMHWEYAEETPDMFDNIISTIEWLIKEGYFNKDYLKDKK